MPYVDHMHYLEYGTGEPVFLLHGGLVDAESWEAQIPALSERYRVVIPERRGHGRTPDVPGPYSIEAMTGDTVRAIEALADGPVHVVGWSDGAYVAAYLALTRPDLVRRLVLMGQAYAHEGETADIEMLAELREWFRPAYAERSPDGPDHFDEVFDKVVAMWRDPVQLPIERLATITAPTLVMQGDDDGVRLEYSVALARALPEAQLAVVPGTGHGAPMQKAELVNRMILDFLAPDQPLRMLPLGSLHAAPV